MAITLRYEKSGGSWSLVPLVFGFAFGVVALLLILKIPIDVYRDNRQAKWPSVVATITLSTVRKTYHKGYEWQIETEVRYLVNGKEQTSRIRSRVASGDEREMYQWVSQHPPETQLPIRYDPGHRDAVAPDAGNMPETGSQVPGDLQMLLIFSVLSITLITIGRVLRSRREENSILNRSTADQGNMTDIWQNRH